MASLSTAAHARTIDRTAVLIFLVRMMPPYRASSWLAGELAAEHDVAGR